VAKPGDVLEIPELGLRMLVLHTGEDTGGELLDIEVSGRPRGFLGQAHVHEHSVEHHTVIDGVLLIGLGGKEHVLHVGESMEIPAGAPHTQRPGAAGEGTVRIRLRPAGKHLELFERLAELSRTGQLTRSGFPRPVAGAELVRDFGADVHAAQPPLSVQQSLADATLRAATTARRLEQAARGRARQANRDYVFLDAWFVNAPIEAVHEALADGRTYPQWWRPVYIEVQSDGPPAVGRVSRQHFKGRLPYHLHTRSTITRLEPPRIIEADVEGDLRGRGLWTLTPDGDRTHVRFDWTVSADRPLLRALTPALRPLLRWNHAWAIARAREGLEPYARSRASAASVATKT